MLMRGLDALQAEGRGYKEYILLRSLGLKAWFTMATSRAGITDPLERCAVGKVLAEPGGEYNIYRRVLAHAPKAAEGDWEGFADGLAADVTAARDAVTDDQRRTTKVRYDAGVDAAHFEFVNAQVAAAARRVAEAKAGDAPGVVALMVPWVDPGAAPVSALEAPDASDAVRPTATETESEPESDIESMFGGKKKKKKKKAPTVGSVAAAAATAAGAVPSLDAVLGQLVKRQAEPTFPEVDAWTRGRGGRGGGSGGIAQATGSDAVAAALAVALAAPPGTTVVAPTPLFASAMTFDLGTLGAFLPTPAA